jgi:hypothetical protein
MLNFIKSYLWINPKFFYDFVSGRWEVCLDYVIKLCEVRVSIDSIFHYSCTFDVYKSIGSFH